MSRIELRAVCTQQVKNASSNTVPESGIVSWTVDAAKPFGDEANLGKFSRQLNINAPLELCHYYEGVVGDVIDLERTPEELAYRPRMSIYLRVKKVQKSAVKLVDESLGVSLTAEEEKLLRTLRVHLQPALGPEDACPVCNRTETSVDPTLMMSMQDRSLALAPANNSSMGHGSGSSPHRIGGGPRFRPEVGVQCGNAGRMNEPMMPVTFGAASRMRESRMDRVPDDTTSGAARNAYFDFDDAVTDLKSQLEKALREREILKRELQDMTQQKVALEKWRVEHRCEVSADVMKLRDENEMLHASLRDLMRGREEVFSLLQQRRTAGSTITDTPRPYTPFAVSVPAADLTPVSARALLSRDLSTGDTSRSPGYRGGSVGPSDPSAAQQADATPNVQLLKRPSGYGGSTSASSPQRHEVQPPGECLLRVMSVSGEPFHVKRKVASQVRDGGSHIFTLLSLDGAVTDEIHVSELEVVSTENSQTALRLCTARNEWLLYLNATERQQWLHWFYALNPYLSAKSNPAQPVPNSA